MRLTKISESLRLPRFSSDLERSFQRSYYVRVRSTLRLVSGLLAFTLGLYALMGLHETMAFVGVFSVPQFVLCLLIFGLTWMPSFGRVWQPVVVIASWMAALLMFGDLASQMIAHPPPVTDKVAEQTILRLIFTLQVCVFMVTVATFRLTFVPMLALEIGVVAVGTGAFSHHFTGGGESGHAMLQFSQPVFVVLLAVLLSSFVQEKLARGAFEFNRRLSELQIHEREMRVETEKMLHILNGAIGSIVHDLGNPLTTVQTGAQLTEQVLGEESTDRSTLRELNSFVLRGARMLGFLRVSLIEQSRVLEGKAVPLELKSVSVGSIVEAGASFQHQGSLQNHSLTIEGDDIFVCADEMKMVTVFMNLIGNAFKYSDGEVRVVWNREEDMVKIAVMDTGTAGRGLTQKQAERLFSAFGRLEEHTDIEGTGLGLLSVRKIVEAHGGEVWVEGFTDGTPLSATFSTGSENSAAPLPTPFLTAFVLTCPVAP